MAWTTPITWAVGDPLTAAAMNTYVRDNENYLYGYLPPAASVTMYVSASTGNDSNDGLSWGTPKATLQAAVTALASTGGTIYAAGTFTAGFAITANVFYRIIAVAGALIQPPISGIGVSISQANGNSAVGAIVDGFDIDGQSRATTTGAKIFDTDRAILRNTRIVNCTTGVDLVSEATGRWCEETRLADLFIAACTTGIAFRRVSGTGSFGETHMSNVGITGCTTGVSISGASPMTFYRSRLYNLVVWVPTGGTGILLDTDLAGVTIHAGLEVLAGTPTAITIGTNAQNTDKVNAQLYFSGAFATKVSDAFSKTFVWRDGDRKVFGVGNFGSSEHYDTADTVPRWQVFGQFAGGGGVQVGPGGSTAADTNLYRNGADTWKTDDALIVSDALTVKTVAGAVTDAAFLHTPANGTIGIDTTNNKIYVRIGGAWKSVTVT